VSSMNIVMNDNKLGLLDAAANKNKWKTASLNRIAACLVLIVHFAC